MKSEYLLRHLEADFLMNGGEKDWLIYGLEQVDDKIKKLSRINNILAHQPWKLTRLDINVLSKYLFFY
jgi:hypothetical protein